MGTAATGRVRTDLTVRVADEVWIALALLHRENPGLASFTAGEIRHRAEKEKIAPTLRPGVATHISQHCVANTPPKSGAYRMLLRLPDGGYRLYRPGDECHPGRKGKTAPRRSEIPETYHGLLDWYEREYCADSSDGFVDPVLAMIGVGKEIWQDEGGDAFIARLRKEWTDSEISRQAAGEKPSPAFDAVWRRILAHQGETFETIKGLPFTYDVEGQNGIWFYREGRRINKRLWRGDVREAVRRCPLGAPSEIGDLFDSAYLYGLVMDKRIRETDW